MCSAGAAPQAGRRLLGWYKIGRSGRYGRLRAPSKRFSASHMKYILRLVNFSWAPSRKLAPASIFVFVGIAVFRLPAPRPHERRRAHQLDIGGFLTDLKVLSAALMKNGLKRRPGVASSSERENSRVYLVNLDLVTAAWRRQCAQCAPSCSPQSPYAHAIGPSYQNCCGEKACNRERAQP